MKGVLLDTSCIVAYLDRSERHHEKCLAIVDSLADSLLTCEAVIVESCYLLRHLSAAQQTILENVQQGIFQIPFALATRGMPIAKLLEKYSNVPMDLADACLVDLAAQTGTGRILTLDRDFTIYRWGKNRPFELLLYPG